MFFIINFKKAVVIIVLILLVVTVSFGTHHFCNNKFYASIEAELDNATAENSEENSEENMEESDIKKAEPKKYIKWVDFNIPYKVLDKTLSLDIKSQNSPVKLNWIELLSYIGARYGGNYKSYKQKDLDKVVERLNKGEIMQDIAKDLKLYNYYLEAYTAILKEFVGSYQIQVKNKDTNEMEWQEKYGLKAFSPIAKGYSFSHYDDFGNGRTFGYKRKHLGNDLMGSIGTPIVAVESGVVEVMGWNIYGGWRIGIRSFDKKRYYYYAHLKKDSPYHKSLKEGDTVKAGDVIGYLGMTGYSTRENVNNINVPHLHFGLQLIFDECQKDGVNQIWIDVYNVIELLQKNKSGVYKDAATKDFYRSNNIIDPSIPE